MFQRPNDELLIEKGGKDAKRKGAAVKRARSFAMPFMFTVNRKPFLFTVHGTLQKDNNM